MINKQLLQKRFTKQAQSYDEFASVQKKMANHLLVNLNDEQADIHILEIGCGTGYLTERLLQQFPHCQIAAVDLAPGMIDMAKSRIYDKRVVFACNDAEEMILDNTYDLIISNATFQWFNQLENTICRLYKVLNPNGKLCFSTFGNLTFQELRASFKRTEEQLNLSKNSSTGQPFYSLDELAAICRRSLSSYQTQMNYEEMIEIETFATVRDFLTSIKKIGANNSNQEDYCTNPAVFKEMIRNYEDEYRLGNGIQATYHCLYFSMEKI